MKKFIVALIAFILAFSALCVVSSAVTYGPTDGPTDGSVIDDDTTAADSVEGTVTIAEPSSGSFIPSFLTGLTSVFTGLTSGLAGVGVSAADSLILDAEGNLTSFSQLGIFFLAISLVTGVVFFLARRIRR